MDLSAKPGLWFVIATLLPLASFAFILIAFAIRSAVRSSKEGTLGASLFQALGGDRPRRWPAFVATGSIGLAFLCSLIGFVQFSSDSSQIHHKEEQIAELKRKQKDDSAAAAKLEGPARDEARKKLRELRDQVAKAEGEVHDLEHRWEGRVDWLRLYDERVSRPSTALQLGFKIDHLNGLMFLMVTFIATLIHVFSMGYMAEELQDTVEDHHVHGEEGHYRRRGRFGRFFLFLSLFCFSMLNLILADNLFQVFLSWELVGICSYLLIGFYFERQSAANASNKAFITNRIGDAGFIIGLLVVWTYCGTFNFDEIFGRIRSPIGDAHEDVMPQGGQIVRGNVVSTAKDGSKTVELDPKGGDVALLFPKDLHGAHLHADQFAPTTADENVPGKQIPTKVEDIRDGPKDDEFGSIPYWMLVVAGLGIFLGCVGKSAQFPLQVWLPDAMEGPTPVSALIHAATMVAAGVYLVGRCFPIFTAEALIVIAYTGAITLFVAATIAVVATDIKKVLAYSTVSQLGYMMLALGVGGWAAGLFHLVTHAFFKALLFLGSGSVIYGCHHEQDMTKMGGLYPKMKITALTMLMGVLAISGIPGFSGWYSKDAIVASSLGFVIVNPQHALLFILPLLTAGLTTFYMFRMWFLTFTGKPRDHHVYDHAHESPRLMTTPLIVLAVFSVCVAWGWPFLSSHFPFIDAESSWLEHQLHHAQPLSVQADFGSTGLAHGETWLGPPKPTAANVRLWGMTYHHLAGNLALAMVVVGLTFALVVYYYRRLDPEEARAQFSGVHRFLSAKWYFDELYSALLVRPALVIAHWCKNIDLRGIDRVVDGSAAAGVKVARSAGKFDFRIIDGLANLLATVAYGIGGWFRRWQTGYLRSYVLFLVLAAVGIFVVMTVFLNRA